MPPSSDITRAVVIAEVGRHSLVRLARHVALLLHADDEHILENVFLAIAGVVMALITITLLLALLRWIRNVLVILLVVLVAAVVRARRSRRRERVDLEVERYLEGDVSNREMYGLEEWERATHITGMVLFQTGVKGIGLTR